MPKKQPLYPHVPKSRGPLFSSLKDSTGDSEGAIKIDFEALRKDGYELRHIIKAGNRVIVMERESLAPILNKVAAYYFDITDIVHIIYRPPVGMGEYCALKAWPRPALIMSIKGTPLTLETKSDLWVYFQISFGFYGDLITPELSYIKR